jgi:iron complex transport system ATP-binding protein
VGPNGCGKSTLLKALVNLLPYRGSVSIDGEEISSLSRRQIAEKAALLAQTQHCAFPYTVRTTITLGRYAHTRGWFGSLSARDETIVSGIINQLALGNIANSPINELSGGQLQRVFLARALAQTPDIILLDEPTNHLDLKNQLELLDFLKYWATEHKKTAVAVLHDLNLVRRYADYVLLMRDGKIAAYGTPREALTPAALRDVYETDVHKFMTDSLSLWLKN